MAGSKTSITQRLVQRQTQTQTLTPAQMMVVRLTEMPLEAFGKEIENKVQENIYLESNSKSGDLPTSTPPTDADRETDDRYDDDYIPRAVGSYVEGNSREIGDNVESLFDHLVAQMGEYELNEHEQSIVRYLIGSLNGDGLLDTPMYQVCMELDVREDIITDAAEVERLLTSVVQRMDPSGVGARDIQECLMLQINRNYRGETRQQLQKLLTRYWDDLSRSHWNKIQAGMKLDESSVKVLQQRIRRLNPKPGAEYGNGSEGDNRTVIPDFHVFRGDDGNLHMELNESELPIVTLSPDADIALNMPVVTKNEREALSFARESVANARMFVDAIRQRRESMLKTMKAIVRLQRKFFLVGDPTALVPMTMEDVSKLTGLDIATTSRVAKDKYVETDYGIYSLRWFFNSAAVKDGDTVSVHMIHSALKEVVDAEDKSDPLSDEALAERLIALGFTVARRTVTKYRKHLNIPDSRLRKL